MFITTFFSINLEAAYPAAASPAQIPAAMKESYKANAGALSPEAFEHLKQIGQCNTFWSQKDKKAKEEYRILVFEGAQAMKHPNPEMIMAINTTENIAAAGPCYIQGKEGRAVFINQNFLDQENFGVRRIFIFHEVAHLVHRDSTTIREIKRALAKIEQALEVPKRYHPEATTRNVSQEKSEQEHFQKNKTSLLKKILHDAENAADYRAAHAGKCETCAQEAGDFFFARFIKLEKKYCPAIKSEDIEAIKKYKKYNPYALDILLKQLEQASVKYREETGDCHSLCIKRGVQFYRYALEQGIAGSLCTHHAKGEVKEILKTNLPQPQVPSTPASLKSGAELYSQEQLFGNRYKHQTVDLILGKPINEHDGWVFEKGSKFVRGEVVAVSQGSNKFTYGVVLAHQDQGVLIQTELNKYTRHSVDQVGKNIG